MNLIIIGATGRSGRLVTTQAIDGGHSVTALVRTPSLQSRERLNVIAGDPRRLEDLMAAFPCQDAVISRIGAYRTKESMAGIRGRFSHPSSNGPAASETLRGPFGRPPLP